jgi:hypothetical protein
MALRQLSQVPAFDPSIAGTRQHPVSINAPVHTVDFANVAVSCCSKKAIRERYIQWRSTVMALLWLVVDSTVSDALSSVASPSI